MRTVLKKFRDTKHQLATSGSFLVPKRCLVGVYVGDRFMYPTKGYVAGSIPRHGPSRKKFRSERNSWRLQGPVKVSGGGGLEKPFRQK